VDANQAADRWGALADGTRRAIVACLADGPQAVGQLAAGLPVSRSAVSQHLKILKDAGLVEDMAAGTRRIYRLNPVTLAALRDQLDTYWQRALETVFEPRVGGSIVDRAADGSECRWARILAFDPPDRVVFSWDTGRAGAPAHRPARSRMGSRHRRRRQPAGLAAVSGPLRRAGEGRHLSWPAAAGGSLRGPASCDDGPWGLRRDRGPGPAGPLVLVRVGLFLVRGCSDGSGRRR
jgi:DNA-binding transcriptional ArsR family regulator